MIIKSLLGLGLAIIPFLVDPRFDTRVPKMGVALAVALALSLLAIFSGKLKPFKNKWVLILLGYLLVSVYFSPKPDVQMFGKQLANFWVWKSILYILIFSLMGIVVASIDFAKNEIKNLLTVMFWAGLLMSLYCIGQSLHLEQWFAKTPGMHTHEPTRWWIGGTLGQPTLVSPFIAMIIPIAILLKKYICAGIMFIAVCLSFSQVAIGAMVVSLLFLVAVKGKKRFICVSSGLLVVSLLLGLGYSQSAKIRAFIKPSGRFQEWNQIVKDIKDPIETNNIKISVPYTGRGPGSFFFVYPINHDSPYHQAHNEYLELGYNIGLIGLGLFLCAMFYMFKINFSFKEVFQSKTNRYRMCLLSSFICIAICAGGVFIWQLGATIYFTIFVVGLLHNKQGGNDEKVFG